RYIALSSYINHGCGTSDDIRGLGLNRRQRAPEAGLAEGPTDTPQPSLPAHRWYSSPFVSVSGASPVTLMRGSRRREYFRRPLPDATTGKLAARGAGRLRSGRPAR